MLNALRPLLLIAVAVLVLPAPRAQAEEARERRAEASERIREVERNGGRVLRAERVQRGGEETYRLKVLTPEGRVRVLHGNDDRSRRDPGRFERRSLLRDRGRRAEAREEREAPRDTESDRRRDRDDD